jgi:ribosomal protein L11 methyltransferase
MALELLEIVTARFSDRTPTMLDVGTGTGVLAIAGKILGTGFTVGIDIDPAAVFTARRNVRLNLTSEEGPPEPVSLLIGTADCVSGSFDIVAANLAAPVLIRRRETLACATGVFLVLSGFADEMTDAVLAAYSSTDLELIRRAQREGWNAALLKRRPT